MKHQLHLRTYIPTYLLALFLFGNQLLANTVHRSFIANNKLQTYCLFFDESNLGHYRAFANTSTQSPVIYHSLQDLSQRSIDKNIEVGTLEGVVDVGALGNATYNLPLELPLGLGAMMPQLSINYNGGNGSQLGKGWALSGLSAITRTSSSNYFESYGFANPTDDEFNDAIDFDKHDRFALDGQRLQNNNRGLADLYYNNAKQKEEYRTFIETYAKITSYGSVSGTNFSPIYFKVVTKNNTTFTYGDLNKAPNCRVHASSTNSAEVLSWLIARQEDQNGNLIDYEYGYDATYNHTKLTKIKYGHSTLQTINTANVAVDFEYGLRSDISEGYV